MNPAKVPGYNQIDAIGLTESDLPVQLEVEIADDFPVDLQRIPLNSSINSKGREVTPVISLTALSFILRENIREISAIQSVKMFGCRKGNPMANGGHPSI